MHYSGLLCALLSRLCQWPPRAGFIFFTFLFCLVPQLAWSQTATTENNERIAAPLTDIIQRFPPAPGLSAEVLQKRVISKVQPDRLATTTTYVAIRIYDDEAVQDYSQIHITYNDHFSSLNLDFARVLDPNGQLQAVEQDAIQIQTPQQSNFYQDRKELVFSLPSLRSGSVIEFQYQTANTQPVIPEHWFKRFFYYWWEGKANQQGRLDAVRESHIEIQTPAQLALQFGKTAQEHSLTRRQSQNHTTYSLTRSDLPKVKPESLLPRGHFQNYYLEVSTLKSWAQVEQWAARLFAAKFAVGDELNDIVSSLTPASDSRESKIRAVYDYMQTNVRYVFAHVGRGGYEPHTALEVARNGYGDCKDQTILTITLLKALGVEAYPALVATSDGADINKDIPYVGFNHMITYIPATQNEPELWLDTSGNKVMYPGFHSSLDNRPALIIDNQPQSRLVTIAPRHFKEHGADLHLKLSATEGGNGLVDFTIRPKGSYEDHFRSWWKYSPERDKALRQLVLGIYNKGDLIHAELNNATDLWNPVEIKGQIELENVWPGSPQPFISAVGVNQLLRLFASLGSFDQPENRVNPTYISHGYRLRLIADIESPRSDYAPFAASAGPSLKSPYFALVQHSEETAKGYRVEIVFELPDQLIEKQQYENFYNELMGLEKLKPWIVNFSPGSAQTESVADDTGTTNKTPAQRIAQMQRLLDSGEFEKALQEAQALVKAYPDNGEAHYFLGLAQGYKGMFDKSNRSFAKAEELGYEL